MRKIAIGIGIVLSGLIGLIVAAVLVLLFLGRSRFNESYEVDGGGRNGRVRLSG